MDRSWIAVPVALIVGAATYLYAPLPADQATVLSITLFSIALWIGNPVPPWFTGILCIGLIGVAYGTETALSGFSQPALWLIVFGLIVGEATRQSGLVDLIERWTMGRMSIGTVDRPIRLYGWLLFGLSFVGLGLVLVIPSGLVRILILGPMLLEVADRFDSREATLGLFLAPLFSTYYAAAGVLTGGLPNIVIAGVLESVTGQTISWAQWFVTMFPVMGFGKTVVVAGTIFLIYRPSPDTAVRIGGAAEEIDRTDAKRMLVILLVGLAVWATDYLHGLHPLYGAVIVAVLALAPGIGIVDYDLVGEVDFSIAFFVGAVFAVANGLSGTGFTDIAATWLLSYVPNGAPTWLTLLAIFIVTIGMMLILEGIATSSVLTPVLISYATSAGLPLLPVLYVEAIALTTYFFPYQSIPLVALLGFDVVEPFELIKVITVLSIATTVTLLPIQILLFTS